MKRIYSKEDIKAQQKKNLETVKLLKQKKECIISYLESKVGKKSDIGGIASHLKMKKFNDSGLKHFIALFDGTFRSRVIGPSLTVSLEKDHIKDKINQLNRTIRRKEVEVEELEIIGEEKLKEAEKLKFEQVELTKQFKESYELFSKKMIEKQGKIDLLTKEIAKSSLNKEKIAFELLEVQDSIKSRILNRKEIEEKQQKRRMEKINTEEEKNEFRKNVEEYISKLKNHVNSLDIFHKKISNIREIKKVIDQFLERAKELKIEEEKTKVKEQTTMLENEIEKSMKLEECCKQYKKNKDFHL